MISRRLQLLHLQRCLEEAGNSLRQFRKKGDPEALHELRIAVKKLKALLLLRESSLNDKFLPGSFEPIRKIFKKAGKIRSAVLHEELLKEEKIGDKKLEKLQEKTAEEKGKKFRDKIKDYENRLDVQHPLLTQNISGVSERHLKRLFNRELRLLEKIAHNRTGDLQLHESRKKLKYLLYILEILPDTSAKKIKLNKFYLKKLEETLGKWHDIIDLIDLFKKEKYKLSDIPQRILHEKTKRREKVHELFKDFRTNSVLA